MRRKTIPVEIQRGNREEICCNGFSPSSVAMLSEGLSNEDSALNEQAWMCFTEFSPDYW